jgi:hypothetical protein
VWNVGVAGRIADVGSATVHISNAAWPRAANTSVPHGLVHSARAVAGTGVRPPVVEPPRDDDDGDDEADDVEADDVEADDVEDDVGKRYDEDRAG